MSFDSVAVSLLVSPKSDVNLVIIHGKIPQYVVLSNNILGVSINVLDNVSIS